MPKRVSVEGRIIEVPDDATPDEIDKIAGGNGQSAPEQSAFSRAATNFRNGITGPEGLVEFGKGMAKGALGTLANVDSMASKVPGVRALVNPVKVSDMQQRAQTTSPTQAIGKGTEQAAEFLVPGGAEESAIARLGGGFVARAGVRALTSGAVNKAQGGSFAGGAAAGGLGEGIATGLKAVAPTLAEIGLKVRKTDKGFGRDPGAAILAETTGIRPSTVAASAKAKIGSLADELDMMAADRPTTATNLAPARVAAKDAFNTAVAQNNEQGIRDMTELNEQLNSRPTAPGVKGGAKSLSVPIAPSQRSGWSGLGVKPTASVDVPARVPIPIGVTAPEALSLKRGVGALDAKWAAAGAPDSYTRAVHGVYSALDGEIDKSLPGSSVLNERMSNLIPVAKRAADTDLNAGVIERMAGRVGAHSGALAAGLAGYHFGGIPGAIAGFAGPELLNSPETYLTAARMANSKALPRIVIPSIRAAGAQFFRKNEDQQ